MNYLTNDIRGVKHGPISEQELIALADQGLLQADSPVKKEIMPGWFPAADLPFLVPHLAAKDPGKKDEAKTSVSSAPEASTKSSFENNLVPVHAGINLRFQAACHDLVSLIVILLISLAAATALAFCLSETEKDSSSVQTTLEKRKKSAKKQKTSEKTGKKKDTVEAQGRPSIVSDRLEGFHPGSIWHDTSENGYDYVCLSAAKNRAVWCPLKNTSIAVCAAWLLFLTLASLRFLIPAALKAQTPGMYYYGIFISDAQDPRREVLEIRAVCVILLGLIFWIASPFLLLLGKPTVAESLTETRIIRISAKKD